MEWELPYSAAPCPGAEVFFAAPVPGADVFVAAQDSGADVFVATPELGADVVVATPAVGADVFVAAPPREGAAVFSASASRCCLLVALSLSFFSKRFLAKSRFLLPNSLNLTIVVR